MAMTVLMKQTRQGDAGAVLSAGSTYTVTEALGAQLVGWGFATDVTGALQPDIDFDVTAKVNGVTGGIGNLQVAGKPVSVWAKPAPSSVLSHWDVGGCTTAVASASDFTYHTTMTVEYSATRFRFALLNLNAATCVVGPAKIAVSNALGANPTFGATTGQTRFTPSTGTWVPVTWSAASTVTLPARISATQPSITYSDWIDVATIPRTDGGTLPVVMIRYLIPSSGSTNVYNTCGYFQHYGVNIAGNANMGSAATSFTQGRLHQSIRMTGDGVTTPANFQPTTDFAYCMVPGIEYFSKRPGFTMLVVGDSISAGAVNSNLGNFSNGWVRQLTNLVRAALPGTPIETANISIPNAVSATFLPCLNAYITAGGKFDVAIYSTFSPNGGTPTQAIIDSSLSLAAQAIDICKTAGKPTVLVGPTPNTALAWTAPQDAFRLQARTETLAAAYSHVTALDTNVIGDGASPERFQTAYTTDNTHPNESGHAAIAAANYQSVLALLA